MKRKKYTIMVVVGAAVIGVLCGYFLNFGINALINANLPCQNACCVDFSHSVDADFGVDPDGTGINTSFYVGFERYNLASIGANFYNLVLDQGFTDNDQLMAWLETNYPDTAYQTYVQLSFLQSGDARGMVNPEYSNKSLDGTTEHVCEPGILLCGLIQFGVFYENGTFYGLYEAAIVDVSNVTSIVEAINTIPPYLVAGCGESFEIEINSLVTNPGAGDPIVTVTINGVEYELPAIS
jgi:hypothetical protein